MILECNMTTCSDRCVVSSKNPLDFISWHFFSDSDSLIRTWAIEPTSKRSKIRAENGVLRYLIRFPVSFRNTLLHVPVLWLLALDRLALIKLRSPFSSEGLIVDTAPDNDSLFLKWLLTCLSSKVCKKDNKIQNYLQD